MHSCTSWAREDTFLLLLLLLLLLLPSPSCYPAASRRAARHAATRNTARRGTARKHTLPVCSRSALHAIAMECLGASGAHEHRARVAYRRPAVESKAVSTPAHSVTRLTTSTRPTCCLSWRMRTTAATAWRPYPGLRHAACRALSRRWRPRGAGRPQRRGASCSASPSDPICQRPWNRF